MVDKRDDNASAENASRRGFISQSGLAIGGLLALSATAAHGQAQERQQPREGGPGRLTRPLKETLPEAGQADLSEAALGVSRADLNSLLAGQPTESVLNLTVKDLFQLHKFFTQRVQTEAGASLTEGSCCCTPCCCCCAVSVERPVRVA